MTRKCAEKFTQKIRKKVEHISENYKMILVLIFVYKTKLLQSYFANTIRMVTNTSVHNRFHMDINSWEFRLNLVPYLLFWLLFCLDEIFIVNGEKVAFSLQKTGLITRNGIARIRNNETYSMTEISHHIFEGEKLPIFA